MAASKVICLHANSPTEQDPVVGNGAEFVVLKILRCPGVFGADVLFVAATAAVGVDSMLSSHLSRSFSIVLKTLLMA